VCHYCGYEEKLNPHCASCGVDDLDIVGTGTEKIEELVQELFPKAIVSRLDLDSAKGKHSHEHIIAAFENREVDILVGTQMVSKGLDFGNVNLVGILQADMLLFQPGYRTYERAYQLMTQVSGRAGRKDGQGKVIIQTFQAEHPVLEAVRKADYLSVFQQETTQRNQFKYPPFVRLIQLTFAHQDPVVVEKGSLYFANAIRSSQLAEVLGPTSPYIGRVNNQYLKVVLLKTIPYQKEPIGLKSMIANIRKAMAEINELKAIRVSIDVDPVG
jgi:primosomal protein N' (replication factor Y)